jgi:AraC family L-rhamnose operon regulatory protein RhaS
MICFVRDQDRHLYEHTENLCLTNVLYRSPKGFQFISGLDKLLPQEEDGQYVSHWRINQSVLQQARPIIDQMAQCKDDNIHAIASREVLFMQLLVLLRQSCLDDNFVENNMQINHLMMWLEDNFADDVNWNTWPINSRFLCEHSIGR